MNNSFFLVIIFFYTVSGPNQAIAQTDKIKLIPTDKNTFQIVNTTQCPILANVVSPTFDYNKDKPYLKTDLAIEPKQSEPFPLDKNASAVKLVYQWGRKYTDSPEIRDYALPVKGTFKIDTGFSEKSHKGAGKYAADILLPIGTKIFAARSGVVVELSEEFPDNGLPLLKYIKRANFVKICHADGTIGNYYHLKQNGVIVNVGDKIKQGGVIAESGNSGFSAAAHLHFHVAIPLDAMQINTIPFTFNGKAPREGVRVSDNYTWWDRLMSIFE